MVRKHAEGLLTGRLGLANMKIRTAVLRLLILELIQYLRDDVAITNWTINRWEQLDKMGIHTNGDEIALKNNTGTSANLSRRSRAIAHFWSTVASSAVNRIMRTSYINSITLSQVVCEKERMHLKCSGDISRLKTESILRLRNHIPCLLEPRR